MVRRASWGWWLLLLVPLLFGTYAEGMFRSLLNGASPNMTNISEEQWFWQRLDHFDWKSKELWKQRYFVNDTFYVPGGPVFLELGGEGPAANIWTNSSSLYTYAEQIGALYVLLEHRYYGKSQPTKDISTDNLRFLSSQQALKDIVYFQRILIKKLKLFKNKWIVFGGSYAGSLAAWLRKEYPKNFYAAVAYSAPIYAKLNFSEYLEVVQKALFRHGGSQCVDAVRNASQVLLHMLKNEEYHANISSDFRLCNDSSLDSEVRISYFLHLLLESIAVLVQNNRERPLNQDQMNYDFAQNVTRSNLTLNYFCGVMTAESLGTPYERLAYFSQKSLEASEEFCLYANYDKYIEAVKDPQWNGEAAQGWRQWLYQSCTEFGFFQTTDSKHQPFLGIPMSYYIDQCEKIFSLGFNYGSMLKSVENTNKRYYKPLMRHGRRILFPNGDLDPWHVLSISSKKQRNLIGMSIKDSSHCEAMFADKDDDPQNLKDARDFIFRTLWCWS